MSNLRNPPASPAAAMSQAPRPIRVTLPKARRTARAAQIYVQDDHLYGVPGLHDRGLLVGKGRVEVEGCQYRRGALWTVSHSAMAASIARFEDLCRAREFAALLCRLGRFDLQWKTVHGNSETLCHHELDKPFVERRRLQMGRGPVTVPSDLCGVFIPDPEGGLLVVRRHPTGEMAVSLGVGMGAGVLAAVAGPPWPEAGVALVGLSALLAANSAMLLMRTLNQPQYRIHRGGVSACSPHMTGLWHLPARSIESVFVEGNCIQLIGDGWVRTLPIGVFAGAGRIMPLVAAALCGQQFEPGP